MFDKVEYWLELCDEDLKAAKTLLYAKNYLWMGFICHLIAEKALKAVIASVTDEVPPKIHDLKSLAKRAGIADALSWDHLMLKGMPVCRLTSFGSRITESLRVTVYIMNGGRQSPFFKEVIEARSAAAGRTDCPQRFYFFVCLAKFWGEKFVFCVIIKRV